MRLGHLERGRAPWKQAAALQPDDGGQHHVQRSEAHRRAGAPLGAPSTGGALLLLEDAPDPVARIGRDNQHLGTRGRRAAHLRPSAAFPSRSSLGPAVAHRHLSGLSAGRQADRDVLQRRCGGAPANVREAREPGWGTGHDDDRPGGPSQMRTVSPAGARPAGPIWGHGGQEVAVRDYAWPSVATWRSWSETDGYAGESHCGQGSRRADSNRGPLHYERPRKASDGFGSAGSYLQISEIGVREPVRHSADLGGVRGPQVRPEQVLGRTPSSSRRRGSMVLFVCRRPTPGHPLVVGQGSNERTLGS